MSVATLISEMWIIGFLSFVLRSLVQKLWNYHYFYASILHKNEVGPPLRKKLVGPSVPPTIARAHCE